MSSIINLSGAADYLRVGGVNSINPVNRALTPAVDSLYEPFNAVYGRGNANDLPLEVTDYLMQIKSHADAISSSLVSMMQIDTEPVMNAIRDMIDNYNSMLEFSRNNEMNPDFEPLENRLTALGEVYGPALNEAGVDVNEDGSLTLDEERAEQALADGRAADVFSGSGDDGTSFARGLASVSERGMAEPESFINSDPPHRSDGGNNNTREYLRVIQERSGQGLMFSSEQ